LADLLPFGAEIIIGMGPLGKNKFFRDILKKRQPVRKRRRWPLPLLPIRGHPQSPRVIIRSQKAMSHLSITKTAHPQVALRSACDHQLLLGAAPWLWISWIDALWYPTSHVGLEWLGKGAVCVFITRRAEQPLLVLFLSNGVWGRSWWR